MPSISMPTLTRQSAAHREDMNDWSSYVLIGGGLIALLVVVFAALLA